MDKVVIEINGERHELVISKHHTCDMCTLVDRCDKMSNCLCQTLANASATEAATMLFRKQEPLKGTMMITIDKTSYRLVDVPYNKSCCDDCALKSACITGMKDDSYLCEILNGDVCHAHFEVVERKEE